jgi:hypothetical protein
MLEVGSDCDGPQQARSHATQLKNEDKKSSLFDDNLLVENAPLLGQPPALVFVHLTPRASQRILSRDMVCGMRRFIGARKLLQDRSAK